MKIGRVKLVALLMSTVVTLVLSACSSNTSSEPHKGTANLKLEFQSGGKLHASRVSPKFATVVAGTVNDVTSGYRRY